MLDRQLPPDGLAGLQGAVRDELMWAERLPANIDLDDMNYRRLMSIIFAGLYALSAQGRVEALSTVPLIAARALLEQDRAAKNQQGLRHPVVALSNTFKTRSKYGFQPVTFPVELNDILLDLYLPMRERKNSKSDAFFVDFNGASYSPTSVGHLVTVFFRRTKDLHITSTRIRSLVEIMAKKAHDAGVINATQHEAVHHINGHSSGTTQDYYLRDSRLQDAQHGVEVFGAIGREYAKLPLVVNASALVLGWGSEHPYRHWTGQRVPWTAFELETTGTICSEILSASPDQAYKVVRLCLERIKASPELVAKFHPHHTLDGSRLAYAWKQWKKERKIPLSYISEII